MRQVMNNLDWLFAQTTRRFEWNDSSVLLPADWRAGSQGLPREDFDFVVAVRYSPIECAFNGTCAFDGRGEAIKGYSTHSSWTLDESKMDPQRWTEMVRLVAHEAGHTLGLAVGEMYDLHAQDATGVEPIVNCDMRVADDPFWSRHADWLKDPMVRNDGSEFCAMNRAILNGRWSYLNMPLPPSVLAVRINGLPTDDVYRATLYRQNSKTGPDGYPVDHQENIFTEYHTGEYWNGYGDLVVAPLLLPGESVHTLLTLDLFLLKIHGPGVSYATWLTVWDWMISDDGELLDRAELVIDFKPAAHSSPPPPMETEVRLVNPSVGFDVDGKPVFRFTATGLDPDASYLIEESKDGGVTWREANAVVSRAHNPNSHIEVPQRDQAAIYRLMRNP